jgi:hypothetical protein
MGGLRGTWGLNGYHYTAVDADTVDADIVEQIGQGVP